MSHDAPSAHNSISRSEEYYAGWHARRDMQALDTSWTADKQEGWNDAMKDDLEESEYYNARFEDVLNF